MQHRGLEQPPCRTTAQITHRQAERQAANSPEQAKEKSPEERDLGTLGENCSQIFGDEQTQEPGRNDPTEYAACEPKCFPRPMFHAAIRHIEAAGRETTEPVQKHSQGRIWSHFVIKCELQMKYFFQRNHHTIRQNALRLHEKPSHFALPAFIYFSFGHLRTRTFEIRGFQITDEQPVEPEKQGVVVPTGVAQCGLHLGPNNTMALFALLETIRLHQQHKTHALHDVPAYRRNASDNPPSTGIK